MTTSNSGRDLWLPYRQVAAGPVFLEKTASKSSLFSADSGTTETETTTSFTSWKELASLAETEFSGECEEEEERTPSHFRERSSESIEFCTLMEDVLTIKRANQVDDEHSTTTEERTKRKFYRSRSSWSGMFSSEMEDLLTLRIANRVFDEDDVDEMSMKPVKIENDIPMVDETEFSWSHRLTEDQRGGFQLQYRR